jgi:hypothetical protein
VVRRVGHRPVTGAVAVATLVCAPSAHADGGWLAVANSPTREAADWAGGKSATQYVSESQARQKCAVRENANDCSVVASGPNCVAIAWYVSQPMNRINGGIGDTPATALAAAVAAAGPMANDPTVHCSYETHPMIQGGLYRHDISTGRPRLRQPRS